MIALVVDEREREVYARVRIASAGRFAITFETGATIEADAHEGVRGLVVEDLPALQRASAPRVRGAQRRRQRRQGEHHQEHQRDQSSHEVNVRPAAAGGVSP